MLKEFIEHIQNTAQPKIEKISAATFAIFPGGIIHEVRETIDHPDTLQLSSLDALVKLVRTEAMMATDKPLYITIPDHLTVRCFTQPEPTERFYRETFYEAKATDVPGWGEKVQLPFEEMQIALRTRFQETPDAIYAMKLLSDITTGGKITYNDNGIATSVVTKNPAPNEARIRYEKPVCRRNPLCRDCNYEADGFVCWHDENRCLRTDMMRIQNRRR